MNKILKTLFIVLLLFILIPKAQAAKLAPGSAKTVDGNVVEVPPLQPIPPGAEVNISRNIQNNSENLVKQENFPSSSKAESMGGKVMEKPAVLSLAFWLILLLLVGVLSAVTIYLYRIKGRNRK